jgi:hypothetical protein
MPLARWTISWMALSETVTPLSTLTSSGTVTSVAEQVSGGGGGGLALQNRGSGE